MAINWTYDATQYEAKEFSIIPTGDHRVRINEVVEKTFNSGNSGFEITLDVSGHGGKLWFYLVLDANDVKKTNQRIGDFFESFGITDPALAHYRAWIGKVGGVRVKHEEYNGNQSAKVAFCLNKRNQEKLPAAQFSAPAYVPSGYANPQFSSVGAPNFEEVKTDDDLPF